MHTPANLFLAILEDEAKALAQCFNIQQNEAFSSMLVSRIQTRCQGERFYVPARDTAEKARMKADVLKRYNGRNADELAAQWGISARHVRNLSKRKK